MDRLIIENVRCFSGRHEVPLAPLTILVGENSTGKSTFLALVRLAWDLLKGHPLQFNEEPFLLGAYEQIATRQGKRGVASEFVVGLGGRVSFEGRFGAHLSQPMLKEWNFEAPPFSLETHFGIDERAISVRVGTPSGSGEIDPAGLGFIPIRLTPLWVATMLGEGDISRKDLRELRGLTLLSGGFSSTRPYAFSPIRTRPLRTYDPIKEMIDPEGAHVPMVLANLRTRDQHKWQELQQPLDDFGASSGLFEKIEVRRLGEGESDPFQLQVVIGGSPVNLVDVGYGVSQILPIVVDCLREESNRTFLLQQPEVHLHPKAQAALGSFLAYLARRQDKRFIVETHSDYLLDRIRVDLRDGKHGLQPSDVMVLYFERQGGSVKIHPITFDQTGNLENAPPGYRQFFLDEERRFWGI